MANYRKAGKSSQNAKPSEEILLVFQKMCKDQRILANNLSEIEAELNEHNIAIDTLKHVDPKRKCYELAGSVLCERTVENVMPGLIKNKEGLVIVIDDLTDQLRETGIEINEFKKKHNIKIRGQQDLQQEGEDSMKGKRSTVIVS
ncbi:prefoldin subunit 2-like [Hylaeus volcanicus]|uniref:prefoldin subunit 2-like n=1 Tax=Hylaeus volcanicus TaxID=313075 RepID=UPI0023B7DBD9|nr:prefoldin subunit 2-like [Hylaeus volcanicus]